MIDLPEELKPWEAQLSLFPSHLALSLGPFVLHLARELGPMKTHVAGARGEPDGYDGIARRGPFERLLPLEWALALELPDEFLRRASRNEQAFFQLASREPAGSRRSLALFDAGPSQLGAPRLVHLAALIALARRAEKAGAHFSFGVLQRDEPQEALTRPAVHHLLQARGTEESTAADLDRWLSRFGEPDEEDDLWLVGGERLALLSGSSKATLLAVRDLPALDERGVAVEVRRPREASQRKRWSSSVELELPPKDACVRLLRDPFASVVLEAGAIPAIDERSPHLFISGGRRFIARLRSGGLLALTLPHAPGRPHEAKVFELGRREALAAGFDDRWLRYAQVHGDHLIVRKVDLAKENGRQSAFFVIPPLASERPSPGPRLGFIHRRYLLDGAETLFELGDHRCHRIAQGVTSLRTIRGGVAFVRRAPSPALVTIDGKGTSELPFEVEGTALESFFGYLSQNGSQYGVVAVHVRPRVWKVLGAGAPVELWPPEKARVVGVCVHRAERALQPALLLLEEGAAWIAGRNFSVALRPRGLRGRIVAAQASPYGPVVALLTDAGELLLHSLSRNTALLRLEAGS